MKNINVKKTAATILSAGALFAALASSSLCILFFFGEPKMPKSLYKQD